MPDVEVYEFSRAFDGIKKIDRYGWVSGGYSPEKINRANRDVPKEIRQAVFANLFALNDNYPPDEGKLALIAREIAGKNQERQGVLYAVLAVANQQRDDGGRPTVGYRYFWLESDANSDLDGVFTLLYWWILRQNELMLYFDMQKASNSGTPQSMQTVGYFSDLSHHSEIQEKAEAVRAIPQLEYFGEDAVKDLEHDLLNFHRLAYALSKRVGRQVSWAWNVRRLLQAGSFVAIVCATAEDCAAVPTNVQWSLPEPQAEPSQLPRSSDYGQNQGLPLSYRDAQLTTNKKLSDALTRYSNNPETDPYGKVENILVALANDSVSQSSIHFDTNLDKLRSDTPSSKRYKALLALLLPDRSWIWLKDILHDIKLGFAGKVRLKKEDIEILEFQYEVMEIATEVFADFLKGTGKLSKDSIKVFNSFTSQKSSLVNPLEVRLTETVDAAIHRYLNEVFTHGGKEKYRKIKHLLTQGIWSTRFQEYANQKWQELHENYANKNGSYLPLKDKSPKADFLEQVSKHIEFAQENKISVDVFYRYRRDRFQEHSAIYFQFASLLEISKQIDLAQLFYILSGNFPNDKFKDGWSESVSELFFVERLQESENDNSRNNQVMDSIRQVQLRDNWLRRSFLIFSHSTSLRLISLMLFTGSLALAVLVLLITKDSKDKDIGFNFFVYTDDSSSNIESIRQQQDNPYKDFTSFNDQRTQDFYVFNGKIKKYYLPNPSAENAEQQVYDITSYLLRNDRNEEFKEAIQYVLSCRWEAKRLEDPSDFEVCIKNLYNLKLSGTTIEVPQSE
jgi:hypothetical protein